jgi:hypothetical protein
MKTSLRRAISGCVFGLALGACTTLFGQASSFVGQDVGTPAHAGSATPNVGGTISINGGGDDIWNAADNCYYYYSSVTGLVWEAKMRVVSFTGPDYWSKVELMSRRPGTVGGTPSGPDAEINIEMTQTLQQNEVRPQWRPINAANSTDAGGTGITPAFPNQWVRMTRVGSVFSVYNGTNGVNWTRLFSTDTSTTANGFDGTPWENPILVGVAVTAHNDGDANGATAVVSNLTVALIPPPTAVGVVTQIQSTATFQYTEASFTFVATNNATPGDLVGMTYAWYKNNQLVSSNLMGPQYTFLTTPADNGAQIYAIATPQAPYNTLSVTSSVATLTVNPPSFIYTNGLKREFFAGGSRRNVEIGSVGRATSISLVSAAQLPGGFGDNYADRFSGYFIPPATAAYVFFVAADDDTDLFLSTDSTPANKQLIAQELGWSGTLSWLASGSTGPNDITQKRSDLWSPDPVNFVPPPYTNGFYLTAGNLYYLEVVHHNGTGGDNFAVTYQTTNQIADPNWNLVFTNGSASLLQASNNNIALVTSPTTTLNWTLQPTNLTVFEGGAATFFSKAVSDSELAVQYQWYTVSPAAPINGATGPTLVIPVSPISYNGLQGYCVAHTAENGLSITSSVATLTVLQSVFEPGWVQVQWWDSSAPSRTTIEAGNAPPPQHVFASPRFESPIDTGGDNYANRLVGYFVPPTTGDYVFFMNSDDDADLFLSTDNTPGNKRLVCQEVGWAGSGLGWTQTGGGGDTLAQRRSDQFTDPNTGTQPYSSGIHMIAGQRYYMEGVHHEGGGGDYFAATYKLFTDADPVNGDDSRIAGNAVGMFTPRIPWVAFLQQPAGQTVTSGGNSVTFSALGYSAPSILVGRTTDPRSLFPLSPTNVTYQWYRNGTPISGATARSYTLVPILPSDNNAQFACGIRALGYADNSLNPIFSNSVPAVLTVITDTVPPTITYAATLQNTNPLAPLFVVDVTFSKWMDASTLTNPANYSVAGATITNIVIAANHRTVELDLNQMPTLPVSVVVNGVKDVSGNTIALNSTAPINPVGLTCSDVGTIGVDPAYPSSIWVTGGGGYIISAQGSDIWDTHDGFNFTWELKTNDFDVVVRGVSTTHTSQWAKMGLMVRETLDLSSRNWNIINDPASADGINAPDGSGLGANTIECNTRQTAGAASGGWGNLAGGSVPAYPNAWVRLKRTANLLEAFRSVNGLSWTRMAAYDTGTNVNGALPSAVYVGLCTTAHNNDAFGGPPPPPFKYYNTVEYANYTSSYVPPAQLTAVISGANVIVSWAPTGGHLEASPAISGPGVNWQPVGGGNPATVPIGPGSRFFRVKNP